jgi:hypothetical protein
VLVETISSTSCRRSRRSRAPADRAASGDLVIEHNELASGDITDDRADLDVVITKTLLGGGRHRGVQQSGESGRRVGIAKVGRQV